MFRWRLNGLPDDFISASRRPTATEWRRARRLKTKQETNINFKKLFQNEFLLYSDGGSLFKQFSEDSIPPNEMIKKLKAGFRVG